MSTIQKHNEKVYLDLEDGDLVEFKRGVYSHWAVFIGGGEVIHLAGVEDDGMGNVQSKHVCSISGENFNKAIVRIDKFWDVVGNNKVRKNNKDHKNLRAYGPAEIVRRALSKLGRVGYNLIFSNCEHFATWCRYDIEKSDQVDSFVTGAAVGGAIAFTFAVIARLAGGSSEKK